MSISDTIKKAAFTTAFNYIGKNPEVNAPKLMDSFERQRNAVRAVVNDPSNNMYKLMMSLMKETDTDVLKTFFQNFFLNANLIGWKKQDEYREKYNCNIPWAILLDPTSACNLKCVGCWAAGIN